VLRLFRGFDSERHSGTGTARSCSSWPSLIGFRPTTGPVEWLLASGLVVLAAFAVTWLCVAFGLVSKSVETASNLPMPLTLLPFFGSGFVPTESMPDVLRGSRTSSRSPHHGNLARAAARHTHRQEWGDRRHMVRRDRACRVRLVEEAV
jgi:hypothetical protein